MKTFFAVFFAILAAAGVIGGVWMVKARKDQENARLLAKVGDARAVADETLRFIRQHEELIYREPTQERVEGFAKVFSLSKNFLADLPPIERTAFVEEMNARWKMAMQSIQGTGLLDKMPPPLE